MRRCSAVRPAAGPASATTAVPGGCCIAARATAGDKAAPVVIFCKADCWMSWNAAKRAVAQGYTGVNWYPEGVDGWVMAGGDLVVADAP